ncbi:MAG TPA: DUF4255 domain-containing protein [Longimicrobium sp.]|jgi:hypothetical protein
MSDIRATLEAVRQRLNEWINGLESRPEPWVVLSNLVDPEGKPVEAARGKLVMFLAGIQKETMVSTYTPAVPSGDNEYSIVAPPLYVDLYVMVIANFYDPNYSEGLGMISLAISFFQQNPSFTPASLPGLPPEVERLSWEMTNLDPLNLSYLMGIAGIKYLPSAYYKVRLLPFTGGAVQRQEPGVAGIQSPGDPIDPPASGPAPGPRPLPRRR